MSDDRTEDTESAERGDSTDARDEWAEDGTGHTTDAAELDERDRAQPNLVTEQANLRPEDEDGDEDDREEAIETLEQDRTGTR